MLASNRHRCVMELPPCNWHIPGSFPTSRASSDSRHRLCTGCPGESSRLDCTRWVNASARAGSTSTGTATRLPWPCCCGCTGCGVPCGVVFVPKAAGGSFASRQARATWAASNPRQSAVYCPVTGWGIFSTVQGTAGGNINTLPAGKARHTPPANTRFSPCNTTTAERRGNTTSCKFWRLCKKTNLLPGKGKGASGCAARQESSAVARGPNSSPGFVFITGTPHGCGHSIVDLTHHTACQCCAPSKSYTPPKQKNTQIGILLPPQLYPSCRK